MGFIFLYQLGLIKHLPEPPLPGFNADKVDASSEAYAYFATPDAVLGLTSYAITIGLAAMIVMLAQALLGMFPVAPFGLLLLDPHLPPWLPDLCLEGVSRSGCRWPFVCSRFLKYQNQGEW